MESEITRELVHGYITAVTTALREAGHKADDPFVDDQDGTASSVLIAVPDAFSDEHDRSGLALMWQPDHGWDAGIVAHRALNAMRVTMHTDLRLGVVPAPEVVVRAVAAIVEAGSMKAGRIVPDTAELLARYAGGEAPVSMADRGQAAEVDRLRAELERAHAWIVGTKREVLAVARKQWDKEVGMGGDVQEDLHMILGMAYGADPYEVEIREDGTVRGESHRVEPDGRECRCAFSADHDESIVPVD